MDCGLGRDGLVHISQLSDSFVDDPSKIVQSGQEVQVKVLNVDLEAKRLQLTMREDPTSRPQRKQRGGGDGRKQNARGGKGGRRAPKEILCALGDEFEATVTQVGRLGYTMSLNTADGQTGLLKNDELLDPDDDDDIVSSAEDFDIKKGDKLPVYVKDIDRKRGQVNLALTSEGTQAVMMKAASFEVMESVDYIPSLGTVLQSFGLKRGAFPSTGKSYAPPARAYASQSLPLDVSGYPYPVMAGIGPNLSSDAAPTVDAEVGPPAASPVPEVPQPVSESESETTATAADPEHEPVAGLGEGEADGGGGAVEAAAEAEDAPPVAQAEAAEVTVSAAMVKELRAATGAGMMDCKKALKETGGDVAEAEIFLKKKGMASADKKAGRTAAEGLVSSYIHAGSRIGVLLELNCETDFVARNPEFKEMVDNFAMQIAANPNVEYVSVDDADPEFLAKEREIEMGKEDLQSKPENIRAQIVEGRMAKLVKEKALLEQAYIIDTEKTVGEVLKEKVAKLGENMQVRRFVRFNLGEGIEKKTMNFADEVAEQMGKA